MNMETIYMEDRIEYHKNVTFGKRLTIALIISAITAIGLNVTEAASTTSVCVTKECVNAASWLIKSMDLKQNPCDDFYSFVCNNWIKDSFLSGENLYQVNSKVSLLNTIISHRIKEILDNPTPSALHENRVKNFYRTCLNRPFKDKIGYQQFLEDLKEFGGWPMVQDFNPDTFSWADIVGKLFHKGYPYEILFKLEVEINVVNITTSNIRIKPPPLYLVEQSYYLNKDDKYFANYKDLILELALYIQPNLDRNVTMQLVEDAVSVETFMAKNMQDINKKGMNTQLSLADLETLTPNIPWRKILRMLLPPGERITNYTPFLVTEVEYFKALSGLVETSQKITLANYMMYRTVLFAAENLGTDLLNMVENKMKPTCHSKLWEVCVSSAKDIFHMSITHTYAKIYMDHETRTLLEEMVKDLQQIIFKEINEATWLDEPTRKKALLKVTKARFLMAYRDEMMDDGKLNEYYNSIRLTWSHFLNTLITNKFRFMKKMERLTEPRPIFKWSDTSNLLVANAYYWPYQNAIIVPIGILQDTFFEKNRPSYLNYGSLGTLLGHEFTHAFDNSGSLYDEIGNYKFWWTPGSYDNYQKRTKCYVDQYNQYYEPNTKLNVSGTFTLGENIADNGGILVGYNAYLGLLERKGEEQSLPGLSSFTDKQMFWISYATNWCQKETVDSLAYTMKYDTHSTPKFRVFGTLSNTPQFAKDFNCKKGAIVESSKKCHLWQ